MLELRKLLIVFILFLPIAHFSKHDDNYWKKEITKQRKALSISIDESNKIGHYIVKNCKNDSILAHSYSILGTSYTNKGDYIKAFEYCYRAKEMFSVKSHDLRYLIYNNIALSDIYKRIGLVERAEKELESTIKLVEKADSKNYYEIASLNISYGSLLTNLGKNTDALPIYLKAEEYLKKIDDRKLYVDKQRLLSIVYSDISNIYVSSHDYPKAEVFINKAIETLRDVKSFDLEHINTITLAEIYVETKRERQAIEMLLPLYDHPDIELAFNQFIHELLSKAYNNINDQDNAGRERVKIDSIQSLLANQQVKGLKEAYKFIEKDLADKDRQHFLHKIIYISIICGLGLGVVFGIVFYQRKINRDKKIYQDLVNSIEKSKKSECKKIVSTGPITFSKSELELIDKLDKFERERGYLKKDLTLAVLAVELNTNASYLSDIINKSKNKNINTYINELRINYITRELCNNPLWLNYKISYLAELAGFNSHNSFTLVFKKVTSISPSVFLEESRKKMKSKQISQN